MPHFNYKGVTAGFLKRGKHNIWRLSNGLLTMLGLLLLTSCFEQTEKPSITNAPSAGNQKVSTDGLCKQTVTAEVVALEQIITFNRFGAFNPAGMVYALRKDVVYDDPDTKEEEQNPLPDSSKLNDPKFAKKIAGWVKLKSDKRPRPLVLRVHEGECLQVTFWNLLSPLPSEHTLFNRTDFKDGGVVRHSVQETPVADPKATDISTPPRCFDKAGNADSKNTPEKCKDLFPFPKQEEPDYPTTRAASIHVNGLDYVNMDADGANVGRNKSSLAEPGNSKTYTWFARQEGGYFFYSAGALAGGEGDGGQLGLGLFGSVNVEPKDSIWYRSQVTHDVLTTAKKTNSAHYDDLDYEKLAILDANNQIVHSDLNAVIYQPNTQDKDGNLSESGRDCAKQSPGSSCGMSFREFTTIFHDENKVFQAFAELSDEGNPISAIADGMAINYGSSGVGSAVLASKKQIGPAKDCKDCKLEEFFLSSWANGDPAMIVKRDADGKEVEALYPDDPSNVHHSYLGDPVRFRNIHAGPKETHVFHLHAHQWLQDKNDPNANYLDSQTISPGSSYTYDIQYGGGGNRNLTVGDAIFHCHLYPHFAAGMWELWRNHDVFEDGLLGYFDKAKPISASNDPAMRSLPDHEIANGTPNPAIVPIPGYPLAPLPSAEFRGYPFYIAGEKGHRPPQPPLDMARDDQGKELNGGLPRHVIFGGEVFSQAEPEMQPETLFTEQGDPNANKAARYIAKRTWQLNKDPNNLLVAAKLKSAKIKLLPQCGTRDELLAMAYHAGWTKQQIEDMKVGKALPAGLPVWCKKDAMQVLSGLEADFKWEFQSESDLNWPYRKHSDGAANAPMSPLWEATGYKAPKNLAAGTAYDPGYLYRINGYAPAQGAPFADPCPSEYYDGSTNRTLPIKVNRDHPRLYKTAYIQFDMTVNKYGWHDPQARMPVLEEDAAPTFSGDRLAEPLFFRANSGDCIQFQATNLIPSNLNLDDFQIFTPTDTIGQHIHLVKFDVTSSDGSANGWNYEDGTFSPDEVRERIEASHREGGGIVDLNNNTVTASNLKEETHQMFRKGGSIAESNASDAKRLATLGVCNYKGGSQENPWCGAQSTVQRWWADPVLNDKWDDRTMRAVFTHDHYGPSSHQQHGFYGALIVEPRDTVWTQLAASPAEVDQTAPTCSAATLSGTIDRPCRADGGPTSYAANIGFPKDYPAEKLAKHKHDVRREYNLAFADFAILYNADLRPVNPPSRQADLMLPDVVRDGLKPKPEGVSTEDPGTRLLNYRNEPIPMRIAKEDSDSLEYHQKSGEANGQQAGDMANVFSSLIHKNSAFDLGKSKLLKVGFEQKAALHAKQRLQKLNKIVPNEIVDTEALQAILKQTEKNRLQFLTHLYENEPWRNANGGDPSTPVLATYIGEPLKLHLIQGAQEEQHVFSITGMKWLAEPESKNSGYMNGQQIGISEHFEFDVPVPFGGTSSTDYWFGSPAVENQWDGMWGLVRSYGFKETDHLPLAIASLKKLPEIATPPLVSGGLSTCPEHLPLEHHRTVFIGAWLVSDLLQNNLVSGKLVYNNRFDINDPNAIVFVEQDKAWFEDRQSPEVILHQLQKRYQSGKPLEPLILRVNAGDCITVNFANYLPVTMAGKDGPGAPSSWSYNLMPPIVNGFNFNQLQTSSQVGLQPQLLTFSARRNDGANIGFNSCHSFEVNPISGEPSCKDTNAASLPWSMPQPCRKSAAAEFSNCKVKTMDWYAGDVKLSFEHPEPPFNNAKGLDISDRHEAISEAEFDQADYLLKSFPINNTRAWAQFTPIEFGAVSLRNFGDVIKHSSHGAIGALVVEPREAILPAIDALHSQASAMIQMPVTAQSFHEFVLLLQDDLSLHQHGQPMPNHRMADDAEDTGQKGFNYRTEPLWARNGVGTAGADFNTLNQVNYTDTLSSVKNIAPCLSVIAQCDPETPIFEAPAGSNVRFRVVHPGGHSRQHAFVLHGHNWDYQPWEDNSARLTNAVDKAPMTARVGAIGGIGPSRHLNILTKAGGEYAVPGDYLFRVQEQFQFQGGMWGIFRVNKI